jgi:hypothetical protein
MNKRLQELAEQAGAEFYEGFAGSPNSVKFMEEDFEKFAELIVKECEKAIRTEIAVTDISDEVEKAWEMGMECGVYTIKEHFGVEE